MMPTYAYACSACGAQRELVMSISQYSHEPPQPMCCEQLMHRHFATAPALAMVSEDHYQGLRATDGTDISSRAKHRAYMKAHNVTTVDDFKDTWARAAREREAVLAGQDQGRVADIAQAIEKLGG
jgi:predicted nucleic acid-binding Zn ribbon protein